MRQFLFTLFCCLFLITGCGTAKKQVNESVEPQRVLLEEERAPVIIETDHKLKKRKSGMLQQEMSTPKRKYPDGVEIVLQMKTKKVDRAIPLQQVPEKKKEPPVAVELISALKKKKVFDFVHIDGEKYLVPVPWRGRRLQVEPLEAHTLKKIPVEFTRNGSNLYLLEDACDALVWMAEEAREENVTITVHSGYRSIWYQRKIFRQLMAKGRTWEDLVRYVAPPGYSEHMLGVVVDLYPSNWSFASTPVYQWLKEHAFEYGFSETYPEGGKDGFPWEPWHWKFSGPTVMHKEKLQAYQNSR